MLKAKKVLIFPSGSEGALDIYHALQYNLHFELYGFSGKLNHTDFTYPQGRYYYGDEKLFIDHPEFEKTFISLLKQYKIQYIIPTFDDVALRLIEIKDRLPATVVTSPYDTVAIANNKRLIYQKIQGYSFAPQIYTVEDKIDTYPVFVKPAHGTGSKGIFLIETPKQLHQILQNGTDYIICEYLPGEEITVDCFTDRHGKLRFVGPRVRERVWHGITFRGKTIALSDEIYKIAKQINDIFVFRGSWFFQAKKDKKGIFKLLEFSARQSTNSSFYGKLGVNFSALSLFDAMDMDVSILYNDYPLEQERKIHPNYRLSINYDTIYLDFDDTLIVQGQVNTILMRLIYQWINCKKNIVLLTCHENNLDNSLKKYHISRDIFNEIIWIIDDTPKVKFITEKNSIFIDNYFKDRFEVKQQLGIPVFDVDAVDCLISNNQI